MSRHTQSGTLTPLHRGEGGFRATLKDAGIWELVQLKCEARARCVVRVTSPNGLGHLYFADGQIVHAALGGLQGEPAALEILSWGEGSWDPCDRAWPASNTVNIAWQGLLLRAAQAQDEARRDSSTARALPKAVAPFEPDQIDAMDEVDTTTEASMREPRQSHGPQHPSQRPRTEDSSISYRPEDFEHAVRLDAQGNLLTGHGSVEELAELTAYVCRLGDLVGELLAMGPLVGVDSTLRPGRCLIFRDASGDTVALRPAPTTDLTRLKVQLHL